MGREGSFAIVALKLKFDDFSLGGPCQMTIGHLIGDHGGDMI